MAAIESAVIAIAAVILGWITIEIACKPCLEKGREAIDQSLDPNYDPDSSLIAPQQQQPQSIIHQPLLDPSAAPSTAKTVD